MWAFLGEYLNWILGFLTVLLWGGVIVWYFGPMIRRSWGDRDAEYFPEK